MATASNAESASASESASTTDSASNTKSDSESSSPTLFDRLQTAAKVIWAAFLALVVVFTLIPVVALWFGAVPFDPPPTRPYFAFVALALVGAAALIAAGIYDV